MHPTLVPAKRLIANVEGAMNAVVVQGDAVGTTLYYGKGAGAEPTASAVIADLVDIARLPPPTPITACRTSRSSRRRCRTSRCCRSTRSSPRSTCACGSPTRPACWRDITGILAEHGISIDALLQRPNAAGAGEARSDLIILTHDTVEGRMTSAIAAMQALADRARADRAHPQGRAGVSQPPEDGSPLARPKHQAR